MNGRQVKLTQATNRQGGIGVEIARLALAALAALFLLFSLAPLARAAEPELAVGSDIPDVITPGTGFTSFFKAKVSARNIAPTPVTGDLIFTYESPAALQLRRALEAGLDHEGDYSYTGPSCEPVSGGYKCVFKVENFPRQHVITMMPEFTVASLPAPAPLTVKVEGFGSDEPIVLTKTLSPGPIGPFEIERFEMASRPQDSLLATQAAAAPAELANLLEFPSEAQAPFDLFVFTGNAPTEQLRDVVAHTPPGLVGNPTAVETCTMAELGTLVESPVTSYKSPACPPGSQVGWIQLFDDVIVPLYNLVPPPGVPAAFGFSYANVNTVLQAKLRPGDNGIDIVSPQIPAVLPLSTVRVVFWGVPAAAENNPLRAECLSAAERGSGSAACVPSGPPVPFLRMPTSCDGPLPWSVDIDTYQNPGVFLHDETTMPGMTGCDAVPFDPELSLNITPPMAHAPSGVDVNLSMPQYDDPQGLAEADLRSVRMILPEGMSVNPAAADGIQACGDQQLRLGLEGPSSCPDSSKLGSVILTTPLLDHSIGGSVFLRTQASNDPASGDLYRLAIELRSDRDGVAIRLPGSLEADAQTGQLAARFENLPQLPFDSVQLHIDSGPRAPLTTPRSCGTYAAHAELASWARPDQPRTIDPKFTIDQNCTDAPFAPGFQAGAIDPTAGAYSATTFQVTRGSGEPNISRLEFTLPPGQLARLGGVPRCSEDGMASGNCPATTRIGAVTAGIGEGSNPLYLPQPGKAAAPIYIGGAYRGAPYSVLAAVPAQAGPFDLGTVLVRSAVYVDPETAQVRVVSDPLQQVYGGIPVAYRDVRVNVDRPEFAINPTNCAPLATTGTISSNLGQQVAVSDRFQVGDCGLLSFKPKLALALKGGTARGRFPALRATLTMPRGGANIARASVALPHSEFLAQSHLRTICTRVQFAAGSGGGAQCPPGSVYGRAIAISPLLDRPLSGPVYLRSSSNPLPDLVAALDGQIHVDLVGRIDSKNGGIRTTFGAVPDAPVTKFVLKMQGGKKGLLENSTDLCGSTKRATAKFDAQNGKVHDVAPALKASRCYREPRRSSK